MTYPDDFYEDDAQAAYEADMAAQAEFEAEQLAAQAEAEAEEMAHRQEEAQRIIEGIDDRIADLKEQIAELEEQKGRVWEMYCK